LIRTGLTGSDPLQALGSSAKMAAMSFPRVFFDTNEGSVEHGYWLGFDQSRNDLEKLGAELREGTMVTLYMPDELELTATLRFDQKQKVWWADPIADAITYLDGSA
jgi:hypothetical protein